MLPTKYLLISSIHCELCTLKQYSRVSRLFPSAQQPASSLYLKLCAISAKSAASVCKAFGNALLVLIPRTFWRRHLRIWLVKVLTLIL